MQLVANIHFRHRDRVEFGELGSCVRVEVAVLGSPSPISLMVSVDALSV